MVAEIPVSNFCVMASFIVASVFSFYTTKAHSRENNSEGNQLSPVIYLPGTLQKIV